MATICLTNYIAIGCKKLWHWRKEKIAASQNQQLDIQNQENPAPPNNNCLFNNSIYNTDITSLKNLLLVIIVAVSLWVIQGILLSLIDTSDGDQVAMKFFVMNRFHTVLFMFVSPIVLLVTQREAKQHVKYLFWNEWAPDFMQVYNPNRVHEIELNRCSKV